MPMDRDQERQLCGLRTPCYVLDEDQYLENIREFRFHFKQRWGGRCLFGYSVKTNHLRWPILLARKEGFLAEVVSPDEYEMVRGLGFADDEIIYNGPQKRDTVLSALRRGALVNLDSLSECGAVAAAARKGELEGASVGLRVNFDLEARCPGETTCGNLVSRFGICEENGDLERALSLLRAAGVRVAGLHMHQSSSSRSLGIFRAIAEEAAALSRRYGLKDLDYVDMGGGYFGGNFFPGKPSIPAYAEIICETLKQGFDPGRTALVLEPGAGILATAMDYLTSVLNFRDVRGKTVVTLDGTLLHINPFMHPHPTPFTLLRPGSPMEEGEAGSWIFAGSTCMELDRFQPRDIRFRPGADSRFLFHCCGAYMATHNSNFINAAPLIYRKKGGAFSLLREKDIPLMGER